MADARIPSFEELMNPTLQALHRLGGSGTNQEIHDAVALLLGLSDEQVELLHKPERGTQTVLNNRLSWARTFLRKYGLLENSRRAVWALTAEGQATREVDTQSVNRAVINMTKEAKGPDQSRRARKTDDDERLEADEQWRENLLQTLTAMDPIAFERLCQRILRESGFTNVEVTSASHDGGIDGKGILQVNDFLSFRVVFQCKRFAGSVGPNVVQQLRGAMPASADRGLIVTTGRFTSGAKKEATRSDRTPIELVDGEGLVDRLKELELGVKTEEVVTERVTVNPDFFAGI